MGERERRRRVGRDVTQSKANPPDVQASGHSILGEPAAPTESRAASTPCESEIAFIKQVHDLNRQMRMLARLVREQIASDELRGRLISQLEILRRQWRKLSLESAHIPYHWYQEYADRQDGATMVPIVADVDDAED